MKIIETSKGKAYQWEESDRRQREIFEEAIGYGEFNSRRAWASVEELIKQIDSDAGDSFRYDWILGAFRKC